jgi:glycosyltransferase involved in cell wall biosynthesis
MDAELLAIAHNTRADDFRYGKLRAVNRPNPLYDRNGLNYHLAHLTYAKEIVRDAKSLGADLVVSSTEPYPFLLEPLTWLGVKVVPALHATFLPEFKKATLAQRLISRASRRFLRQKCYAILTHPGACARQARQVAGNSPKPLLEFLPLFHKDLFDDIQPPQQNSVIFRVITVGRLERSKGVFDLIEIATKLRESGRTDIHFDVCGTGSALADARNRVEELSLGNMFSLHGWVSMEQLMDLWAQSHVAVVPTTRDFVEGFNQVVIEAILAGRPVITSEICPAIDYVKPCAIQVPAEDPDAYREAIISLADDPEYYENMTSNCERVGKQFLDPNNSFAYVFRYILESISANQEVRDVFRPHNSLLSD